MPKIRWPEKVRHGVPHLAGFAPVDQTLHECGHQPVHLLGRLQKHGAPVGAGVRLIETSLQETYRRLRHHRFESGTSLVLLSPVQLRAARTMTDHAFPRLQPSAGS